MGIRRTWPILVLTLVVGFAMGGLTIWAYMVGPAGYRPLSATRTTMSGTPSASATSVSTPAATTISPSPRSAASMAFDAATGKIVLFGGYVTTGSYHEFGDFVSDTWTWDGMHWSPASTTGPLERSVASMTFDAVRRVVVLREGTETWNWNGTRWILMGPNQSPPAPGFVELMSWDSQRAVVLLFSGAPVASPMQNSSGPLNRVWRWDGASWTQLPSPATSPNGPPLYPPSGGSFAHAGLAQVAYDTTRNVTVYFGHVDGTSNTWTFDGATWNEISTTTGSASTFISMASDDARSDIVLFGENGDTWTWDGSIWTPRNPAHSPSPRREASMAYDSTRHVVVLFGGYSGSAANLREFNDTWTWNGSDWTQVVPPSPTSKPFPPPITPSPR